MFFLFLLPLCVAPFALRAEDVVLGMLVEEVNGQTTENMTTGKIDALVNRGAEV